MEKAASAKGRPPKSRLAPEVYFLPQRPLIVSIGIYGTIALAGLGAGMLIEKWISARVEDDGGFVTLGSKKEEILNVPQQ